MSATTFIVGMLLATLGWQFVASLAGPPLALALYRSRVQSALTSGIRFSSQEAMDKWTAQVSHQSSNAALLGLAAACGFAAGVIGFPLFGISRSTDGWSWARVITLCASSWAAVGMFHLGIM